MWQLRFSNRGIARVKLININETLVLCKLLDGGGNLLTWSWNWRKKAIIGLSFKKWYAVILMFPSIKLRKCERLIDTNVALKCKATKVCTAWSTAGWTAMVGGIEELNVDLAVNKEGRSAGRSRSSASTWYSGCVWGWRGQHETLSWVWLDLTR